MKMLFFSLADIRMVFGYDKSFCFFMLFVVVCVSNLMDQFSATWAYKYMSFDIQVAEN